MASSAAGLFRIEKEDSRQCFTVGGPGVVDGTKNLIFSMARWIWVFELGRLMNVVVQYKGKKGWP
jgi:hypothetical protein